MAEKNKEEIKKLEAELKQKQEELKQSFESPFSAVGASDVRADGLKRNRPKPNHITAVDGESANAPHEIAHAQRMSDILRPPSDSSSESMREWAEREIHGLAPEALASLKWDIKHGDAKERAQARGEIFRAMGIDKREANNFGKGGQIVINLSGPSAAGDLQLPFLKRTLPNSEPTNPIIQTLTEPKKESK